MLMICIMTMSIHVRLYIYDKSVWDGLDSKMIMHKSVWDGLDSKMIDLLVQKGPKRDYSIVKGPKNKFSRRFTTNVYSRVLSNGEKCDRD